MIHHPLDSEEPEILVVDNFQIIGAENDELILQALFDDPVVISLSKPDLIFLDLKDIHIRLDEGFEVLSKSFLNSQLVLEAIYLIYESSVLFHEHVKSFLKSVLVVLEGLYCVELEHQLCILCCELLYHSLVEILLRAILSLDLLMLIDESDISRHGLHPHV